MWLPGVAVERASSRKSESALSSAPPASPATQPREPSPAWLKAVAIAAVVAIAVLDATQEGFEVLPLWGYPAWVTAIVAGDRVIPSLTQRGKD